MKRPVLAVRAASALLVAPALACSIDVDVDAEEDEGAEASPDDDDDGDTRAYVVRNLVSDVPFAADHHDPSLVNPWGLAFGPQTHFWVANEGTSTATIYDGDGNLRTDLTGGPVTLPSPTPDTDAPTAEPAEESGPTGIVWNGVGTFEIAPGIASEFLFATTAGTLLAWSADVDPRKATIVVDKSGEGTVYTGLAIAAVDQGALLYAPDFTSGHVDVFDEGFVEVDLGAGAFLDRNVPEGYAPFGVHEIEDFIYVTYAKRASDGEESSGTGSGYVTAFDRRGRFYARVAANGELDAPWGIARAPEDFGELGGALLVGNFGDGRINAFDFRTHRSLGQLKGENGKPLAIEGLWAIAFGNDKRAGEADDLYFTAGPDQETHGLFGEISAVGGEGDDHDDEPAAADF